MKKTLEFTEQELNIVLFALQKQPFEMVNELIRNVVSQLQTQGTEIKGVEKESENNTEN